MHSLDVLGHRAGQLDPAHARPVLGCPLQSDVAPLAPRHPKEILKQPELLLFLGPVPYQQKPSVQICSALPVEDAPVVQHEGLRSHGHRHGLLSDS